MLLQSTRHLSVGLVVGGALVWTGMTGPLAANRELTSVFNPLGINRSPYGEVFAMAMQGPIDVYFHGATEGHNHGADEACGPDCDHDAPVPTKAPTTAAPSLSGRLTQFIAGLDRAAVTRTNPKPASPALKFYLRRQTEDKLRFAYNLDPANYGNFACYYFFLTQPTLGTRPELTPSAVSLAQETITYCLAQEDDPRPALTAAAAAENILEHLLDDGRSGERKPALDQLRQMLAMLDFCLARYAELAAHWDATGNWDLLSELRRNEVQSHLYFLKNLRTVQAATIQRLGQEPDQVQPPPTPHVQ